LPGSDGVGAAFGGGAGSRECYFAFDDPGYVFIAGDSSGNAGAVRIIWGAGRSYPSNAADV
jgi:hypothetical protein